MVGVRDSPRQNHYADFRANVTMVFMKGNNSQLLPPTDKHAIKRVRSVRQEDALLPGSQNPKYSLFPASQSHDRMIGPKTSPGNAGGLVGRHPLSCRQAIQGGGGMSRFSRVILQIRYYLDG